MAELADASDLGSGVFGVGVQVSSATPMTVLEQKRFSHQKTHPSLGRTLKTTNLGMCFVNGGYFISKMAGYEYVIDKNHHRANIDGAVYVHIIEAEKMLGRNLFDGEVVHHKDRNRLNNSYENLLVFESMADHSRFHMPAS